MPLRKSYKKKVSKSKPRRQWKRKGRAMGLVNNALQPFPQRFICKMKYAADVQTTASGRYVFNLNSLFDPDQTGGGHQPYGYDNLTAIYKKYRVISCGWRITTTSATSVPIQLGTMPTNAGILPVNFAELKEQPRSRYVIQNPGANSAVVSGKAYMPSVVGRTKHQYMSDDRFQAEFNANPLEAIQLQVHTADANGTLTTAVVNVILEFTAEFFDVNNVAQS